MKISTNGVNLIASFEGCKLTAYQDVGGVWTIGYGHTKGVKPGDKITEAQAKAFLKEDIATFETAVNRAIISKVINFDINQNQFDALVSFAYNVGPAKITNLCNRHTPTEIANKMLEYNKVKGTVIAGLTRRRQAERDLFLKKVTTSTASKPKEKCPYKKAAKNRTFKQGSNGESVKWIQWQLNKKINAGLKVDGDYGAKTVAAIKKFQQAKGLKADGICGPKTIEKLAE